MRKKKSKANGKANGQANPKQLLQSLLPDDQAGLMPLTEAVEAFSRAYIEHALTLHNGNRAHTAAAISVNRTHLYHMLHRLDIDIPPAKRSVRIEDVLDKVVEHHEEKGWNGALASFGEGVFDDDTIIEAMKSMSAGDPTLELADVMLKMPKSRRKRIAGLVETLNNKGKRKRKATEAKS